MAVVQRELSRPDVSASIETCGCEIPANRNRESAMSARLEGDALLPALDDDHDDG